MILVFLAAQRDGRQHYHGPRAVVTALTATRAALVAFGYKPLMNQYRLRTGPRPDNSLIPTVIFTLLVVNGLMFAAQNLSYTDGGGLLSFIPHLMLWSPDSGYFLPFQLLTYGFLHGDTTHLAFNMIQLWMFGRDLERVWGARRFVIYYLTAVVGAGITQLVVASLQGGTYPTLGASGGVFGILLAFGMLFPNRQVMLLFPPIPMAAKYLVILFGLFELSVGISGASTGIAHFAHLGGMLFGFGLIMYWRRG